MAREQNSAAAEAAPGYFQDYTNATRILQIPGKSPGQLAKDERSMAAIPAPQSAGITLKCRTDEGRKRSQVLPRLSRWTWPSTPTTSPPGSLTVRLESLDASGSVRQPGSIVGDWRGG